MKTPVTGKVDFNYQKSYNFESLDAFTFHEELTIGEFARTYARFYDDGIEADLNNKDLAYIIDKGNISVPYAAKRKSK